MALRHLFDGSITVPLLHEGAQVVEALQSSAMLGALEPKVIEAAAAAAVQSGPISACALYRRVESAYAVAVAEELSLAQDRGNGAGAALEDESVARKARIVSEELSQV